MAEHVPCFFKTWHLIKFQSDYLYDPYVHHRNVGTIHICLISFFMGFVLDVNSSGTNLVLFNWSLYAKSFCPYDGNKSRKILFYIFKPDSSVKSSNILSSKCLNSKLKWRKNCSVNDLDQLLQHKGMIFLHENNPVLRTAQLSSHIFVITGFGGKGKECQILK